jgi:hypothetical protein
MTTDILDLPGWTVLAKRLEDREYELEAEYTVKPTACQKCGVLDRLYRHGTKDTIYRDSPIRGHATRILARVQRYRCRECGETFLQPLAGIQEDRRMTARCAEYIKEQCLRDTFTSIADHVGCDGKTVRNLAGEYIATLDAAYFDHPISNAYTEALNGVAKTINRAGRGYSFEVLRARLLFGSKPRIQPPKETPIMTRGEQALQRAHLLRAGNGRCQSCSGAFEPASLFVHLTPAVVPGEHRKPMLLCTNCHRRFHTDEASGHASDSTH